MSSQPPHSLGAVSIRQLAYLREAARRESFTAAAEMLGLSQPALSQALAELERRLGVALFEPAGRQRRLTDDGREVLAFADRVLAEASELRERLEAHAAGERGSLRVGMIDAASLYALPDVIHAYRLAYPGVELSLRVGTSTDLVAQLRAFEFDLVFAIGPVDSDLAGVEVQREPLHVYAPPDAADPFVPPADAEWSLYESGSRTRTLIDAGMAGLGIQPRVTLESGNPEVLRQMVVLGLGWSVLPAAVAQGRDGALHGRQGAQVAERALCALWRASGPTHARAEAFLRLVEEQTGGGESSGAPVITSPRR